MRKITHIVLHCTATSQKTTVKSIQNYWRNELGWRSPGYHHIILPNGKVVDLLPIEQVSNGVAGHNANAIHISYIGGINGRVGHWITEPMHKRQRRSNCYGNTMQCFLMQNLSPSEFSLRQKGMSFF